MIRSNKLFYGDNKDILNSRLIADESVDLCYIDPPFNSNRNYNQIYNNEGEDKAQTQAFLDTWEWSDISIKEYEEIIGNIHNYTSQTIKLIRGLRDVLGDSSLMAYLVTMTVRINLIWHKLKNTGSFYLHCDPTASHYLKLICDSIFCGKERNGEFLNEIIWQYFMGGKPKSAFARKHDVIFLFSKSKKHTFNFFKIKRYLDFIPSLKDESVDAESGKDEIGYWSMVGCPDVWSIKSVFNMSKERLGYPTQKPEALLERIIKASSNEGDLVLDAFCGCGTTVAVAQKLNRQWIGIDITYQAISLILKRLEDTYGKEVSETVVLHGVPKDLESAIALAHKKDDRVRKEFEKWAILTYTNNAGMINEKKGADGGVDGRVLFGTSLKEAIISVKSDKNPGDNMINSLLGVVTKNHATCGILILLEEPTKVMIKTAKALGTFKLGNEFVDEYPIIKLVTVKDILENKVRLDLPLARSPLKSAKKVTESLDSELF